MESPGLNNEVITYRVTGMQTIMSNFISYFSACGIEHAGIYFSLQNI